MERCLLIVVAKVLDLVMYLFWITYYGLGRESGLGGWEWCSNWPGLGHMPKKGWARVEGEVSPTWTTWRLGEVSFSKGKLRYVLLLIQRNHSGQAKTDINYKVVYYKCMTKLGHYKSMYKEIGKYRAGVDNIFRYTHSGYLRLIRGEQCH